LKAYDGETELKDAGRRGQMRRVSVSLPEVMADLYPSEREALLRCAIRHAAFQRAKEKEAQYEMARRKVAEFEEKYGMDLDAFCEHFPDEGDMQTHEDWVEWNYWSEVHRRLKAVIHKLRRLEGNEGDLG